MKKTRKIETKEEYDVCDLCGNEILEDGERSGHHKKCVEELIIEKLGK